MAENVVLNIQADDKATSVISNLTKKLAELASGTSEVDKRAAQLAERMRASGSTFQDVDKAARGLAQAQIESEKSLQALNKELATGVKASTDMATAQVGLGKSLLANVGKFALAFTGLTLGLQAVARYTTEAVSAAKEYQLKLMGLNTIANNFGIGQEKINNAIQTLTADGLMTQAQAVTSLTSMFSSYVTDVDQATMAIMAFKDLAAAGGRGTYDFATKVNNLSESFLTEMSMLGNNSGMQENWNQIIKVGEQVTGKKAEAVSYLERQQIKLAGVMEISKRAEGAAIALTKTHVGAMQMAQTGFKNLQLELGNALIPAIGQLGSAFVGATGASKVIIYAFRAIGVSALGLVGLLRTLAGAIAAVFGTVNALGNSGLEGAKQYWNKSMKEMADTAESVGESVQKVWSGQVGDEIQGVFGKIPDWANEAGEGAKKATKKMLEDLKKENEKYNRELQKRNDDFKRSLFDLITAHQDKVKEISKQLSEETDNFKRENAERVADYDRSVTEMEKRHLRKVRDINQDLTREDESYANKKSDLLREIAEEEAKGIMIFGVWNSQADQKKLEDLRARLDEEENLHQQRLADLQQNLTDETEDYTASLEEKKRIFEEETLKAQEEHNKRASDLQAELNKEQEILLVHKDLVASTKDMMVEDDIARLMRQHEEEKAENERAHLERLEEIKNETSAQGGAMNKAWSDELGKLKTTFDKNQKDITTKTQENAKTTGIEWIKNLVQGLAQATADAFKKFPALDKLNPMLGTAVDLARAFGLVKEHGGVVPGETGAPVPIIAHGGERVVPRSGVDVNSGGSGGGLTINMNGPVSMRSDSDIKYLADEIIKQIGRRNELERLGVGL